MGVTQKSLRLAQPQIPEKRRRRFSRAPDEHAREMLAAHSGFVGDLFDAELFAKMAPAETGGPLKPVPDGPDGPDGLGRFLPPFEQKGVGTKTHLGAIKTGGSDQQTPQRDRRRAPGGQRDNRTELALEFPKEIACQRAVKIEPAKNPRLATLQRVVVSGGLGNNRDKSMITRNGMNAIPVPESPLPRKGPL